MRDYVMSNEFETVEEYLARGGKVSRSEVLGGYEEITEEYSVYEAEVSGNHKRLDTLVGAIEAAGKREWAVSEGIIL